MITFENAGICGTSYSKICFMWESSALGPSALGPNNSYTVDTTPSLDIALTDEDGEVIDIELNLEQIRYLCAQLDKKLTEYDRATSSGFTRPAINGEL
jgi:hypothetical protein